MAPKQDEHRNKSVRSAEETGRTPNLSTAPPGSRGSVQPSPSTLPRGPLSNPFAPNNHDFGGRASDQLIDDGVDSSSSKGKGVALPIRNKAAGDSAADTNMTTNEDTDMIDAASIPADDDEVDKNTTESGYQRNKDGRMDRSSSKGKGKAHSISPEASIGARYRSSRVSQSNMDMDMDTEDNSGSDHSRDENSQEEGSDGDGSVDQDEDVLQFYPVATVDPPVQEIRVDEDGEAEVRPEDAGEEGLGWEEGVGN